MDQGDINLASVPVQTSSNTKKIIRIIVIIAVIIVGIVSFLIFRNLNSISQEEVYQGFTDTVDDIHDLEDLLNAILSESITMSAMAQEGNLDTVEKGYSALTNLNDLISDKGSSKIKRTARNNYDTVKKLVSRRLEPFARFVDLYYAIYETVTQSISNPTERLDVSLYSNDTQSIIQEISGQIEDVNDLISQYEDSCTYSSSTTQICTALEQSIVDKGGDIYANTTLTRELFYPIFRSDFESDDSSISSNMSAVLDELSGEYDDA